MRKIENQTRRRGGWHRKAGVVDKLISCIKKKRRRASFRTVCKAARGRRVESGLFRVILWQRGRLCAVYLSPDCSLFHMFQQSQCLSIKGWTLTHCCILGACLVSADPWSNSRHLYLFAVPLPFSETLNQNETNMGSWQPAPHVFFDSSAIQIWRYLQGSVYFCS